VSPEVEGVAEFCKRMEAQFKEQLKEYRSYLKDILPDGATDKRPEHAEWAALMFAGKSSTDIANGWIAAGYGSGYKDLANAVFKAAHRFAEDIDLTLPPMDKTF